MRSALGTIAVLGLFACPAGAAERTFELAPGDDTRIRFDSKATLESFSGETDRATGAIVLDPGAVIGDSLDVLVEVEMASLDTGIDKRNEDMRENHLETDRYPTARFRGARVREGASARLVENTPVEIDIEGSFTLHGVTRRLRVPVTLTLGDGGRTLRATTQFPVSLADYAIERPRFLFLKLSEEQQVTVDVLARVGEDVP